MNDLSSWVGGLASRVWEPQQKGLPFGSQLHASPPRRQRTLTGPLDPSQETIWHRLQVMSSVEPEQRTHLQEQCNFLSMLPLDIRMIIYDTVLGGMVFHIGTETDVRNRILTHICHHPETVGQGDHQDCFAPTFRRPSSAPRDDYPQATGLLPLLVTCRRIYSEAIGTLYSANTFDFWQNRVAFHFLKGMLPPQRLHSIRRFRWGMQLPHHPNLNARSRKDWNDLFTFFSRELSGLQHLHIKLNRNHPFEAMVEQTLDDDAAPWIQPMVLMAIEANRKRGCKVEVVTNGAVHDIEVIFTAIRKAHVNASRNRVVDLTCTEMHRRIRLSFDSHD
ncbi:uncharacterized protein LTR77_001348 [Saxophila tyrrhenica]|uniref:DUF7730 domain-containing protein n=1 Tax=Saxophila tyrrhenica TaxID=1690608 RepID=A0AAV9PK88_9PEZI|nr:hypothetical protein LTR77_001348 [Saxophila tyrrhenica]